MHAILSNDLVQSINELRDLDVLLVSILPMKIMGSNKSKPRLWEAMRIQNQDIKSVSFERPICTYVLLSYIWMSQMKGDLGMYFVVPHAHKMEWDGKQMNPTHGPTRVRNPSGCPCDITSNLTWYQGFHFCEVFRSCLCLLWYPSLLHLFLVDITPLFYVWISALPWTNRGCQWGRLLASWIYVARPISQQLELLEQLVVRL